MFFNNPSWDERFDMARLAQSAERKALNLVVVGSSPTVGVLQSRTFLPPSSRDIHNANNHNHHSSRNNCSANIVHLMHRNTFQMLLIVPHLLRQPPM